MEVFISSDANCIDGKKHRKESSFTNSYKLICFDPTQTDKYHKGFTEVVDLRFYNTPAKTYCCVWLNHKGIYNAGSAMADGYNYHRPSQAAKDAFENAGITFSQDIGGRGDSAIVKALEAIAIKLELPHWTISEAYG